MLFLSIGEFTIFGVSGQLFFDNPLQSQKQVDKQYVIFHYST